MRYLIQDCKDASWMIVNLDRLITKNQENFTFDNAEQSELAERLFQVAGIVGVYIEPYKVDVQKAPVYQWAELVPDVLAAIKSVLAPDEVIYKAVPDDCGPSEVPVKEKELNSKKAKKKPRKNPDDSEKNDPLA